MQYVRHEVHYTHSADASAPDFGASDGATAPIGEAHGAGCSASAARAGLPDESCALYHVSAAAVPTATIVSQIMCSR